MDILKSVFSIAKTNNGFFKSKAQASFLKNILIKNDGYIGNVSSGYNTCSVFAKWDKEGIISISKTSRTKTGYKDICMFVRKIAGVMNCLQQKEMASIGRRLKGEEKNLLKRETDFKNGDYNGSGDATTYTDAQCALYDRETKRLQASIENLKARLGILFDI